MIYFSVFIHAIIHATVSWVFKENIIKSLILFRDLSAFLFICAELKNACILQNNVILEQLTYTQVRYAIEYRHHEQLF